MAAISDLGYSALSHATSTRGNAPQSRLPEPFVGLSACSDAPIDACRPMPLSLGDHSEDKMTSLHVTEPFGFALEYGPGGVVIYDRNWKISIERQLGDRRHRIPVVQEF